MKTFKVIGLSVMLGLMSGCAMLPYENEYSCKLKDNYGKCIAVETAYKEAVSNKSQAKAMVPNSQRYFHNEKSISSNKVGTVVESNAYEDYRMRTYQELANRLQEPNHPLLSPPETVRTLVLAYSPDQSNRSLYMPRFVYSILDDAKWVFTEEEHSNTEAMTDFIKTKEASQQ